MVPFSGEIPQATISLLCSRFKMFSIFPCYSDRLQQVPTALSISAREFGSVPKPEVGWKGVELHRRSRLRKGLLVLPCAVTRARRPPASLLRLPGRARRRLTGLPLGEDVTWKWRNGLTKSSGQGKALLCMIKNTKLRNYKSFNQMFYLIFSLPLSLLAGI